jgi:hypothetical protein
MENNSDTKPEILSVERCYINLIDNLSKSTINEDPVQYIRYLNTRRHLMKAIIHTFEDDSFIETRNQIDCALKKLVQEYKKNNNIKI